MCAAAWILAGNGGARRHMALVVGDAYSTDRRREQHLPELWFLARDRDAKGFLARDRDARVMLIDNN